ncbi:MAG: Gfo/Idh/MocA family oxidoreductase [Ignavibacteria bacterium]|nr:Gfo/Idh/MocA family oxidoreductase [Ignavibacteria bacterium]
MKKIRTAVIGLGHLGSIHLKLINEISKERKDTELSGVFDSEPEKNSAASASYGIRAFGSVDEALAESDAVVIVTPTSTHFDIASAAILKGVNTFIEKPVTETTEQAERLLELAKGKKLKVQIGHIERFNAAILSLEDYSLAPLFIETHRLSQFNPRGTDVSVIQDLMIHDIDIILNLVKSPVKAIDANGVAIITDKIDIANARIRFENGCVANITASRISQNKMRKMRLFQKNAYISIDFLQNSSEVFKLSEAGDPAAGFALTGFEKDGKKFSIVYDRPQVKEVNSLKYELNLFFDSIANDTEPLVTLEDGLQALEVANIIVEKIESGS